MTTQSALLAFVAGAVGENPSFPALSSLDGKALCSLARSHDVAHLVAEGIRKSGQKIEDEEIKRAYEKASDIAFGRDAIFSNFEPMVCQTLKDAGIPHVLMKGAVLRKLYPESRLRLSRDMDLLVREEDLEKAVTALEKIGFTTDRVRKFHELPLCFGDSFRLDLHFSIEENQRSMDAILKEVWDHTEPVEEFTYRETGTFFLFHHVAHMCHHFMRGGCGIKPFLDLDLLLARHDYDEKELFSMLERSGMKTFFEEACALSRVWFGGASHTDLTRDMEQFVLNGLAFGSMHNHDAVRAIRKKGKLSTLFSLVFPPYSQMCTVYPVLIRKKRLLPICYLRRLFSKLFGKGSDRARQHTKIILGQSEDTVASTAKLFDRLGLSELDQV